jgi:uncharacterized protein with LGFP repeats
MSHCCRYQTGCWFALVAFSCGCSGQATSDAARPSNDGRDTTLAARSASTSNAREGKLSGRVQAKRSCTESVDSCEPVGVANAEICVPRHASLECATTNADGRFDVGTSYVSELSLTIPEGNAKVDEARWLVTLQEVATADPELLLESASLRSDGIELSFGAALPASVSASRSRVVARRVAQTDRGLGGITLSDAAVSSDDRRKLFLHTGRMPVSDEIWNVELAYGGRDEASPSREQVAKVRGLGLVDTFDNLSLDGDQFVLKAVDGPTAIANTYANTGGIFGPLGPAIGSIRSTRDGIGLYRNYLAGAIYWKPATGAHSVNGDIYTKWSTLNLELGLLGYPVTDGTFTPVLTGIFSYFERGAIYWTVTDGAFEIHGPVLDKWGTLGWEASFLGFPLTDTRTSSDGVGQYNDFQGGSIYWSPSTGAHETHGAIRDKWRALGSERGLLGYPTSDHTATPDRVGAYNHFKNGSIYWSPSTGAHEIHGAIRDKWASLGWEAGGLGYPTSDHSASTDGVGAFSHFQNGSIYWSPSTGAHEIHGDIRDKWNRLAAERGFLGYPITDHLPAPDGIGFYVTFQHGAIYFSPSTGSHEVHGDILTKWAALSLERGLLGYPTSDELVTPDGAGRYNSFERGSIYWSPSTGAHEVHGAILNRWANLGWERSYLGYPTTDELANGTNGRVSRFQGGSLYYAPCSGVTTTPPACGTGLPGPGPGQCRGDADCATGSSCNNPWYNAFGTCVATKTSFPDEPKGRIEYANGPEHNACTTNAVVNELQNLRDTAFTQVSYNAREEQTLPPDGSLVPDLGTLLNATDHVQSIVRLPNLGNQNWMAASISNGSEAFNPAPRGGLFFIELGQVNGNRGGAFRAGRNDNRSLNVNRAYYQVAAAHPGGMQAVGQTLVVAAETDYEVGPAVYFFNAADPTHIRAQDALYNKVRLASLSYPTDVPRLDSRPSAAAVVRMSSGGYLMAVNTGSTQNPAKIWLFVTDYQGIRDRSVHWYFHNYVEVPSGPGTENMTFVTQCDGVVYLLTSSNREGGATGENGIGNGVNAYKLVKTGDKLSLSLIANRNAFVNGGYADFRAAGTFYVSPLGELLLYANGRTVLTEDGNYQMAEFAVPFFCGLGGC